MPKKKSGKKPSIVRAARLRIPRRREKKWMGVLVTLSTVIGLSFFVPMLYYMFTDDVTLLHWYIGLIEHVTELVAAIRK